MKLEGGECDLLKRIAEDSRFGITLPELEALLSPKAFIGRCPSQTEEFLQNEIAPIFLRYPEEGMRFELSV